MVGAAGHKVLPPKGERNDEIKTELRV